MLLPGPPGGALNTQSYRAMFVLKKHGMPAIFFSGVLYSFASKKSTGRRPIFFSGVLCSFASKKSTGRRPIFFLAFHALLHQKRAQDAGQFFFWRSVLLILLVASLVVKGKAPFP